MERSPGLSRSGPTALQQHGQELYRQGDFKTAVEAFTQVTLSWESIRENYLSRSCRR